MRQRHKDKVVINYYTDLCNTKVEVSSLPKLNLTFTTLIIFNLYLQRQNMAESILFSTIENILGNVTSLALEECSLAWGLQGDLKKLGRSLSCINAVILDAEEQTTNHAVANWLRHLKRVLYDAEDVLDEFAYHALRKKVVGTHGGFSKKVRYFFSGSNPVAYRLRLGHKIKDIKLRLDDIAADKTQFNFVVRVDNSCSQRREREMTHSFVNASDMIGRDEDVETLVKFLMDSQGHDENVSVLPIVGIGGLGKTSLAKMVFNDKRIGDHFGQKVWVCVGDIKSFSVNKVMSNLVKSIPRETSVDHSSPELLQKVIQDYLQDKMFLLVLDDLWQMGRNSWLELKGLLMCGAKGSKIVVTTRINTVASCVGTVAAHNLKGLSHEECLLLFKKLAFASEAAVDEDLMKIGNKIVAKCKGLPLAVRVLGSLLYSKPDEREWLLVRDSRMWEIAEAQNDILSIPGFSYDHLPCHLKKCFVYCLIFPEDDEIFSNRLIQFWMAHGLLRAPKQGGKEISTLHPEYVGEQYIKELLSRGFFQDYRERIRRYTFKMHDLVRDLACSIEREEFVVINVDGQNIGENVRHASFEVGRFSANLSNVGLQSVLVWNKEFRATYRFVEACISKFKHLKVLALADSEFEELPKSIATLKHLRSLDLRNCRRLKKLPNSICKLHNLETLLLVGCEKLKELPKHIGELINLRTLEITTQQKQLPKKNGIGCLTSLHSLWFYRCPNLKILFEGEQITHLTSLRTLEVTGCESLESLFDEVSTTDVNYCLPNLEYLFVFTCINLKRNYLDYQQLRDDSTLVQKRLQLPNLKSN